MGDFAATAPGVSSPSGSGNSSGGSVQTATATPAPPRPQPITSFHDQTLRMIAHTSIGGRRVRIELSNVFGSAPLVIGSAHIALARQRIGHRCGHGSNVAVRRPAVVLDSCRGRQ